MFIDVIFNNSDFTKVEGCVKVLLHSVDAQVLADSPLLCEYILMTIRTRLNKIDVHLFSKRIQMFSFHLWTEREKPRLQTPTALTLHFITQACELDLAESLADVLHHKAAETILLFGLFQHHVTFPRQFFSEVRSYFFFLVLREKFHINTIKPCSCCVM